MAPAVRRSLGALVNIAIVFVVQVVNLKRDLVLCWCHRRTYRTHTCKVAKEAEALSGYSLLSTDATVLVQCFVSQEIPRPWSYSIDPCMRVHGHD
eukprot:COSAG02_NODE_7455_length_3006_cov_2.438940_2_plen_95_part_00